MGSCSPSLNRYSPSSTSIRETMVTESASSSCSSAFTVSTPSCTRKVPKRTPSGWRSSESAIWTGLENAAADEPLPELLLLHLGDDGAHLPGLEPEVSSRAPAGHVETTRNQEAVKLTQKGREACRQEPAGEVAAVGHLSRF